MSLIDPIILKGKLVGPRVVQLTETPHDVAEEVEVILHPVQSADQPEETVFEFLAKVGPGTRSREEIDQQIAEERDAWDDP